jgi:hypothetical protein
LVARGETWQVRSGTMLFACGNLRRFLVYFLDVAAMITIETKEELAPGEKRSKNLIMLFVISLLVMVAL